MKEQVFFLNMFPDYTPPEGWESILSQAAVVAADIDPVKRQVDVALHSEDYIPKRVTDGVVTDLRNIYGLQHLHLTMTHPAHQLTKLEPEELLALFVEENSMHRAALAGAEWTWEAEQLTVRLRGNGVKELEESAAVICRKLRQRFAAPVTIQIGRAHV